MNQLPLVLVIDDEIQMRRLLVRTLEGGSYRSCEAETGESGLMEAIQKKPDAVILDLGLPDLDGVEVLRRLREWSRVPVLVLSVRDDEKQKVRALDAGADDYVTKPFGQEELLARLRVILRHAPEKTGLPVFQNGKLAVDFAERRVVVDGKEVKLTGIEYSLLKLFVQHAGKVLTHRQILREIWGPNSEDRTHYLRVYVTHLRQKIESDPNKPTQIKTESGVGYRFCLV
ncbi:MAG: response regulator [Candidatus Omnitrophota bacterium]|jgi:two-component system KDP operon response regulator KdpE